MLYSLFRIPFCLTVLLSLISGCSDYNQLEWNKEEGYQWAEVSPGFWGGTGLEHLNPADTNLKFENNVSKENVGQNRNYLNGSGVAVGDVDGDGLVDIYLASLEGENKLFKNEGGLNFRDVTEEAGVAHEGYNSTGVVFADIDGDGDLDLLVASFDGQNSLYLNDGSGKFTLKENSGLKKGRGSTTMALADIDLDGDLDLYITNYKEKSIRDMYGVNELSLNKTVKVVEGSYELIPPFDEHYGIIQTEDGQIYRNEYGEPDELYINDGTGHFSLADPRKYFLDSDDGPAGLDRDWGLTAKFHDINGDGFTDLYVCNDFWTPDRVWINRGDGTFRSIDEHTIRNYSFSSMGVDYSDINRDGFVDIFVTEMLSPSHRVRMRQLSDHLEGIDGRPQYNRNSLYLNRGDNTFAEVSYYSGLEASGWSWATRFMDIDLDGYEDLLITTGHAYDYQDLDTQIRMNSQNARLQEVKSEILEYPSLALPNKAFRNNGDLSFTDVSSDWGLTDEDVAHGMAVADLDNDGDLDIIMNRLNRTAAVYENTTSVPRIAVRLTGRDSNTAAIGAKVTLEGGPVTQTKQVSSGGDYVSGSDQLVVFASDPENENHRLKITWPNGSLTEIDSVRANRIYKVEQSETQDVARKQIEQIQDTSDLMFEEVSDLLNHTHHENTYDDFNVRPLLPFKLSQQGPGLAWIDYNQDGKDDLLIGSGKGGKMSLFAADEDGTFSRHDLEINDEAIPGDQTAIIGWVENGNTIIVTGSANYEQGNPSVPSAFYYEIDENLNVKQNSIQGILSTTGPLAAADYDGDGDIDLFIGGRFVPGKYPVSADSRLFVNDSGSFSIDRNNSLKLKDAGLVTGAVFTDYDQDGDQDLLMSTGWGSLRMFNNRNGIFNEVTQTVGLQKYKGWWNGVATGDFNNDGKPDIIATNIGENSTYQIEGDHPLRIYYDDFNHDGRLDIIEAYMDEEVQGYVPKRRLLDFESLPMIVQQVESHKEFARSSLEEIFKRDFQNVPYKELNTVQHLVFINTDEGFKPHSLPAEAQFSAAFAATVGDFDNDGNEDIFLSQNTFSGRTKEPRLDAGRGLLLLGDGNGDFRTIPGHKSGIKVYGQQRGAALSDFNDDGKIDLIVSQNGKTTKLYKNKVKKLGIRIRLKGPDTNANAIGASIRIKYADGTKGPRREIQAGSGYWSQNSSLQVMGTRKKPASIEVTWPDGIKKEVKISGNERIYKISKN